MSPYRNAWRTERMAEVSADIRAWLVSILLNLLTIAAAVLVTLALQELLR